MLCPHVMWRSQKNLGSHFLGDIHEFLKIYFPVPVCACVCVCMFVCTHAFITSENNFWESPLSFYHVGPEDQNQSSVLDIKHLYPLSDLAEPCFCYCYCFETGLLLAWNLPSRLTSSCLYFSSSIIAIDARFFFHTYSGNLTHFFILAIQTV